MNLEQRIKDTIRTISDFPKKGIQFKDITPLFREPDLVDEMAEVLAAAGREKGVTAIIGVESRGFLLGPMIASKMQVPFILVRKRGKLPGATIAQSYDLEYGSAILEMHDTDLPKGSKVMIHDDLLATGGTAAATAKLVKSANSEVAMFSFIVMLAFLDGGNRLSHYCPAIYSLANFT